MYSRYSHDRPHLLLLSNGAIGCRVKVAGRLKIIPNARIHIRRCSRSHRGAVALTVYRVRCYEFKGRRYFRC